MQFYLLIVCSVLSSAYALFGFNEENRAAWQNLPEKRGEWIAGQKVTVKWQFLRRPVKPWKYDLCIDGMKMREKCFYDAVISRQPDEDNYYSVSIVLPDNMWSGRYYFKLRRKPWIIGKGDEIAISHEFPVVSIKEQTDLEAEKLRQVEGEITLANGTVNANITTDGSSTAAAAAGQISESESILTKVGNEWSDAINSFKKSFTLI